MEIEFPATLEQKKEILDVVSKEKNSQWMATEWENSDVPEYYGTLLLYVSHEEFSLSEKSPYHSLFPENTKFYFPGYYRSISVEISTDTPEIIELLESFGWDLRK